MIVYTSSTGTVIGWVSGENPDSIHGITHLPSGCDYAIYIDDTEFQSLNTTNAPGTYLMTDIVSNGTNQYGFATATGTLTFTELSAAEQLTNAQQAKIPQLQASFQATLSSGFTSSANGTSIVYGYAPTDVTNMHGVATALALNIETWPIDYADIHGNVVSLTQAQFTQLATDANKFNWAQVGQLRSLVGQVETATTASAVEAIQWTPATY